MRTRDEDKSLESSARYKKPNVEVVIYGSYNKTHIIFFSRSKKNQIQRNLHSSAPANNAKDILSHRTLQK